MDLTNQLLSMGESAATSKKRISKGKPTTLEVKRQRLEAGGFRVGDTTDFLPKKSRLLR
jgi:hypothetical protein